MNCTHALELIEPLAAEDFEVDAALREHIESCPGCAAALATSRRIEAALALRPAPAAPERFQSAVLQRIRRERWRAEQHVDRLFNVAIVVATVLVIGGIAALLNLGGLLAAVSTSWGVLSEVGSAFFREAAPTAHTYIAAAGLLLTALVTWWWADRTVGF